MLSTTLARGLACAGIVAVLASLYFVARTDGPRGGTTETPVQAADTSLIARIEALERLVQQLHAELNQVRMTTTARTNASPESEAKPPEADASIRGLVRTEAEKVVIAELDRRAATQYLARAKELLAHRAGALFHDSDADAAQVIVSRLLHKVELLKSAYAETFARPSESNDLKVARGELIQEFVPQLAALVLEDRIGEIFNSATGSALLSCTEDEVRAALHSQPPSGN